MKTFSLFLRKFWVSLRFRKKNVAKAFFAVILQAFLISQSNLKSFYCLLFSALLTRGKLHFKLLISLHCDLLWIFMKTVSFTWVFGFMSQKEATEWNAIVVFLVVLRKEVFIYDKKINFTNCKRWKWGKTLRRSFFMQHFLKALDQNYGH